MSKRVDTKYISTSAMRRNKAYYRKGLEHALEAVERELRNQERRLEEKHELLGQPVTDERHVGMPLIRQSAQIAEVRLVVVCAIQRLLEDPDA